MSTPSQFEFDWEAESGDEVDAQTACTASATILERIKKLLRLARDKAATQAEAERAMAMAFMLAEKHHVDVAGLNLDDEGEPLVGEFCEFGRRDPFTLSVASILVRFFHVEACFREKSVLFVGRQTDVQIAGYVFDFLRRAGRAALREYEAAEKRQRRRRTPLKRRNFLAGFAWGVRYQLEQRRETIALTDGQSALVLAEQQAREAKLAELVPKMATIKERQFRPVRSAAMLGFHTGKSTSIHQPLTGGSNGGALALK